MFKIKCWKNKKGFSLIELVIVIAILAVLAALLAPALIHYVEDSRATSDISSMDEVVNAVQIGLANPEAYDEMVDASVDGNVSCYIDSNSESGRDKEIVKVGANGTAYYTFSDDNRLLDEVPYTAAGNMRGVTITFIPNTASKNLTYDLKNAVINKHVGGTALLSDYPNLYNRVRQTIGDTVTLSSNTYGNSEYTIFIRIGSGGGSQATAQDPIQVYGQYNGTNLPKSYTSGGTAADRDDTYTPPTNTNPPSGGGTGTGGTPVTPPPPVGGGGTGGEEPTNPPPQTPPANNNKVPDDSVYIAANGQEYAPGDELPEAQNGDIFRDAYYEYRYNQKIVYEMDFESLDLENPEYLYEWLSDPTQNGWGVRVLDTNNTTYGKIEDTINGKPVTILDGTFGSCPQMSQFPILSTNAKSMKGTFLKCTGLSESATITIPSQVINIDEAFSYTSIVNGENIVLHSNIQTMEWTFGNCSQLKSTPMLPNGLTALVFTFAHCSNLTTIQTIPQSVTNMSGTFYYCKSITTAPTLPNNLTIMDNLFRGCSKMCYYEGSSSTNGDFKGYIIPRTITEIHGAFAECSSMYYAPANIPAVKSWNSLFADANLKEAPIIPEGVETLSSTFKNTDFTVAPKLPSTTKDLTQTFMSCAVLREAPEIPNGVINMFNTFMNCTNLTTGTNIPASVQSMERTFVGCSKLTGEIRIDANLTGYKQYDGTEQAFSYTTLPIVITGSSPQLAQLAATATKSNVTIK